MMCGHGGHRRGGHRRGAAQRHRRRSHPSQRSCCWAGSRRWPCWGTRPASPPPCRARRCSTTNFTPPLHSFRIGQADDIVALIGVCVSVSLFVAAAIARLERAPPRARVSEREASLRASLAEEVRRGTAHASVLQALSEGLMALFGLSACAVVEPVDVADAAGEPDDVVIRTPPLLRRAALGTPPLRDDEVETITGVAGAVATVLELERRGRRMRNSASKASSPGRAPDSSPGSPTTSGRRSRRSRPRPAALLAEDSRLDPTERRELLEDTLAEAARLEGLVDKVVELARIRAGTLRPDRVIMSAVDLVRPTVDGSGSTLDGGTIGLDIDPELPDFASTRCSWSTSS